MKNTHLEHPEDEILTKGILGFKNVIRFFKESDSKLSVKYDGSPAVVWGTNPENNRFFVGTKSVFNKKKILINYTHNDIEINHGHKPELASVLHVCLDKLPKIFGVYQGDFIGFGNKNTFTPNVITYKFPSDIDKSIVFAAHTSYDGNKMSEMNASFGTSFYIREENFDVKFLNTNAHNISRDIGTNLLFNIASLVSNFVEFPEENEGKEIKIIINKYIRDGKKLNPKELSKDTGESLNLFRLYNLLIYIKKRIMQDISAEEEVDCYINACKSNHEGYVMSNKYGTFKLVDRFVFSHANFTIQKSWKK